ncbi:MAG TPA: hypothetical protein PKK48_06755, partial [Phycisphaerae bacterium]|nr:hypothetical protein [Phycisphaerae bacterium]
MKNLKKMKLFTLLAIATFLLAGCYPQAAVIWSHDGQHGAVLTKNEIYLCDSQGKLSTESLKYSGAVAWSPNSDDLYYVQPLMINSWKEAAKYVDAKKQAELIALAKDALAKLQPESLKDDKNNPFAKFEPEDTILMLLYLKDNQADELKTKLDAKTLQGIAKAKAQLNQLFVCKNCNTAQPQLILSTFMNIENLKISPNGKAVEFSKSGKTLYVCDMKGRVSLIAQNAAILPDWTSDGNTLIYSSTNNGGIQPPRLTYTQDKKSWRINTSDEIYDVSGGNMSYEYKNGKFSAIGHNVTIIASTSGNKHLAETFIYVYDQNNSAASS